MFRAIGTILILFVLANLFSRAFVAFESAVVATFNTLEAAAVTAQTELELVRE